MTSQPRPEQIHRAALLARRNARRFFSDAKALMACKSYGHAYGLMVLAEEEAGKALIFHHFADGLLRNPEWLDLATRKHEAKHATMAVMVMMRLIFFLMFGQAPHESRLAARKRFLREGTVPGSIHMFYRGLQRAIQDVPAAVDTVADIVEELSNLGQLQARRENGFFVDFDESGEPLGPHQFSVDDCRKQTRLVTARLAAANDFMGNPKISLRRRMSLMNFDADMRAKIASFEAFLFGQKGKKLVIDWLGGDSPKDLANRIREYATDQNKVATVRGFLEEMHAKLSGI